VRSALLAAATAAAISWVAYRRRALTGDGALAAGSVGTVVFARGGLPAATALNVFFVTATVLSRVGARRKAAGGTIAQAKGARRDAWQVLANGGVAAAGLALDGRVGNGAFLGALAAAAADTWATEIGLLSKTGPRLITTLRPVPPGTSGGVTPLGMLATAAGGTVVGASWSLARGAFLGARAVPVALAAGVAGSLVDSLLGATVQAVYWCPQCQGPTETSVHRACGTAATLRGGLPWMTNDTVNALATVCGAMLGALLWGASAGDGDARLL